ncbi:hypothetical protein BH09PSE5_BH09PSE5_06230 [soil metagenome]
MIRQSGTSLNKTREHPLGNRDLEQSLFYPAMVAGKHNPVVAQYKCALREMAKVPGTGRGGFGKQRCALPKGRGEPQAKRMRDGM